jgi:hypothetical protein
MLRPLLDALEGDDLQTPSIDVQKTSTMVQRRSFEEELNALTGRRIP